MTTDYDPCGTPTAIDTLGAFGHNRLSHQGLFADRYDTDAPDLAVDADVMYYARNRDYRPDLGRWVQRDPNGSGSLVVPLYLQGSAGNLEVSSADLPTHYRDGMSTFGFVRSRPNEARDPSGLSGLVGGLMTGMNLFDVSMDMMDTAYMGVSTGLSAISMVQDYAFAQELDAEWALDWSQPDEFVSVSSGGGSGGNADGFAVGNWTGIKPGRRLRASTSYTAWARGAKAMHWSFGRVKVSLPRKSLKHIAQRHLIGGDVAKKFNTPFPGHIRTYSDVQRLVKRAVDQHRKDIIETGGHFRTSRFSTVDGTKYKWSLRDGIIRNFHPVK
ncbi:MAG: hypothetical protein ACF8R9_05215 [Phycisphaerales bacterium JB054]